MTKILLVDDEPALLDVGKLFIERSGEFSVDTAAGGAEALEMLSSCCYDCIVSDYDMPGMNGIDLLKAVRSADPGIPFIIFTGKGREEVVIDAINHGADFYLQKGGAPGAQFAELLHKIRQGVRRRISEKRNLHLNSVLHAIRDIHHLIASERDAESLLRKVARLLVETRGYKHVWILLLDGEGRTKAAVEAGIGDKFRPFAAMVDRGEFPSCVRDVMDRRCTVTVTDSATTCRDCPLTHDHRAISTMATPIEAGGRLLGVLSATLPREFAADEEEQVLFGELGADLGFALQANETVVRRKRAEAGLKASEELYRAVFETTGTAMMILEEDRTIAYANREMARLTGYSREELEGTMDWTVLVPEDEFGRLREYHRIRRLEPGGVPQSYEIVFVNRRGERRHGHLTASTIPGTPRRVVSVLDITRLKEAQAALLESEEKFRSLSESSIVGIYVIRDGRFAYVNPAVSAIFGYSQEELRTVSPYDLVHPEDRETVCEKIARRLAGEAGAKYTFRGVTKAGEVRWFEVFGSVTAYDGRKAVLGTLIDVTGHRETRLALEESERKYRSFLDNTTSGVVVAQDGRIRYANPVMTEHLGREPDGSDAMSFDRYLHPDDLEHVVGMHRRRLAGEDVPENYMIRVIDKGGSTRMMAMNVSVITWDGRPATLNFLTDVTREFALQEAQQEVETNYRTLMENAPIGIGILARGSIVYANRKALDLFGADAQGDFTGREILQFAHPDHRQNARDLLRKACTERLPSGFVYVKLLGLDGREIEAEAGTVPITYQGDAAVCLLVRDLTEQKQSERKYRESRQQLILALESAEMGIWVVDLARGRHSMNARAAGIIGYAADEFLGLEEEWRSLVHPADIPAVAEAIQSHLNGVSPSYDAEYRLRHKDGRYIWVHSAGSIAERDSDGKPLLITGVMHDITARKEAAEALRRGREDLLIKTTALDVSATAVSMLDPGGTIFYANDAFVRMWGYGSRDEVIGTEGIVLRQASVRYPEYVRVFQETGSFVGVLELARRDGSPITVHVSAAVVMDDGGKPLCLIASMIDITQLEAYRRGLERVNEKLNILADITRHDILNQLGAIRGYLSFIRADYPDDPAGYVAKIERAAETIEHQISFTRDYQYMGVVAPEWQRVDRMVEQVLTEIDTGRIEVAVSTGPLEIYADPLFRKVIYNLFDNALRHGGAVTRIGISFSRTENGGRLRVEDDGAGIPAEMKERIFQRGVGRNTGYGLFLVREILDITGMTIRETGTPGEGARFEIAVPAAVCRMAR